LDRSVDGRIEKDIENTLEHEMHDSGVDIRVRVQDGYVTLFGFVDTLGEKNSAGEIAGRIEGVKSIENCLTISTDGTFTDKETEAEVISKLKGNPNLTSISAKVQRGVAVLEGTVHTLKDKNLAIHQASKALGVKDIASHIHVDSLYKVDDISVNNEVQRQLVSENLDDCDIKVEVENGSVTLKGYVDTSHEMETAMEITEGVEGVRNVKNYLKVREPGQINGNPY
jgi:hyperosmotically inducible periplasmic protein